MILSKMCKVGSEILGYLSSENIFKRAGSSRGDYYFIMLSSVMVNA